MTAMAGGGAALQWAHRLRRRQDKTSTATASGLPSEDLGLCEGDGGAALKLDRVHGMATTRARRSAAAFRRWCAGVGSMTSGVS